MSLVVELGKFLKDGYVLILEPTPNYRTSLKNFLANLKVKHVKFVSSVAEAKRELITLKVSMFIVEWQLPEKNGLQFCRELRKDKNYKNTPFLLLSTENYRKDVILASEGGVNTYLIKPFSYEDFCLQLSNMLLTATNPTPVNSLIERAEFHLEKNEVWVAEALLNEALTMRPTSAKALCGLGRLELINKNHSKALNYFREALTNNPDYVDGYKYILQISEASGDTRGILQNASILRDISPENPKYHLLIAFAHMELGNIEESEKNFKACIRLSPTIADGYKGLGNLYLQQKEYDLARKNLEKALDLDRGDVSILNSLGLSYVRQNMIDDGIIKYRIALAIDAGDERVLFNLAIALELKGNLTESRDMLQRAIASNSSFDKAKRALSRVRKLIESKTTTHLKPETSDAEYAINSFKKGA